MKSDKTLEEFAGGRGLKKILEAYRDWVEGNLVIEDPDPPRTFPEIAFRLDYSLWFWTVILMTGITLILVLSSDSCKCLTPLRYFFGSIFVLFLPGYTLVRALYPKRELSPIEELALSIGLSLAVVPLVGLVLNYTPFGIRITPVLASLSILVALLSLIGLYREYVVVRENLPS